MKKVADKQIGQLTHELIEQLAAMADKEFGAPFRAPTFEVTDTLPGQLVLEAYRMCGGRDQAMIGRAAAAIQLLHQASLSDNPEAAIFAKHGAMMTLANLEAPAELVTNVMSITNRSALFGQQGGLHHRLDWLTTERILNPLHVGMVLAGADCYVTDAITPYAHALGDPAATPEHIIAALPTRHTYWDESGTQFLIDLAQNHEP